MAARKTIASRPHVNHVKNRQKASFEHGAVLGATGATAAIGGAGAAIHKHLQNYNIHARVGRHTREGGGYEAHLYSTKNMSNLTHVPEHAGQVAHAAGTVAKAAAKAVRGPGGKFVKAVVK